jgi:hypothetical protein
LKQSFQAGRCVALETSDTTEQGWGEASFAKTRR